MILTDDSIERFLLYLDANGMSPHTQRAYKGDLKKLLAETGPMTDHLALEQEAAEALTRWRTREKATTTNRRLASIRSFAQWQGVVILNHYKAPTPAQPIPHPLPEGIPGVMLMAYAADLATHRALVAFCGLAGLRVQEARFVTPSDIEVANDGPLLMVHGKGARERVIPLSAKAFHFIESGRDHALRANRPTIVGLADSSAREVVYRLSRLALGRERPSHDLRATFATAAYRASGGDIEAVRRLLGHASVTQTQTYIGHSMDEMRKAAEVA